MAGAKEFFSRTWRHLVEGASRTRNDAWPIVQGAGAAGIAWFLAYTVLGHPQPFFAPIAAVAALAVNIGERGQRVIGMLVGVVVGVVVAWVGLSLLGTSPLEVALIVAVAMLATRTLVSSIIGLIQSGASAAIVITLHSTTPAGERVFDALIGGGVALVVSQVLFAPSPRAILTNAGREALGAISEGLRESARALSENDDVAARAGLAQLRESRGSLDDLAEAREASARVSRRTLRGRWETSGLEHLDARLGEADLLFESALFLARAVHQLLDERGAAPEWLCRAAENLASGGETLAEDPEGSSARSHAQTSALEAERTLTADANPHVTLVAEGVRLAASDLLRMASLEEPESARIG
jgi:uncharacterized membrane protein YgaE (UPF0421/DUF939 family)